MTGPRPNLPSVYLVTSKTTPIKFGQASGVVTVINNSSTDTVWIGNSGALVAGVAGWPIQPQSSLQYGIAGQNTDLWAELDPAASNSVQLIVGGDVALWSPSPVKVVNISGPVAVTGDVGITGTVDVAGSVDITSGTVDATITGPVDISSGNVDIVNTPSVTPLPNFDILASGVGTSVTINDTSKYNTLLVLLTSTNTHAATSAYNQMQYALYSGPNGTGVQINGPLGNNVWVQASAFDGVSDSLLAGNITYVVIPLNGAQSVGLTSSIFGTSNGTINFNVFGTNAELPFSVTPMSPGVYLPNRLMWASHSLAGAGSSFPIPCYSQGVRIYFHLNSTAAASSVTVRLTDTDSGVQLALWTVPRSFNAGNGTVWNGTAAAPDPNPYTQYIDLPDTMAPLTLSTGSVTTPSVATIMVTGKV